VGHSAGCLQLCSVSCISAWRTPWGSLETAALAYAASLDAAFAASPGEALEEALLAVGELLGGLSMHGFARDLAAHLERVEEDRDRGRAAL
jgi:hypothetical protein